VTTEEAGNLMDYMLTGVYKGPKKKIEEEVPKEKAKAKPVPSKKEAPAKTEKVEAKKEVPKAEPKPKVEKEELMKRIKHSLAGLEEPLFMSDLAKLFKETRNKVVMYDGASYREVNKEVQHIKEAIKSGVEFKKHKLTLDEIKKMLNKKTALIARLIAFSDKNQRFIENYVQIVGYDRYNMIINDYYEGIKERKVKYEGFMKAFKNAKYKLIKIRY